VEPDAGLLGGPGVELAPLLLPDAPTLKAGSSISPSVARDKIESRLPPILPAPGLSPRPRLLFRLNDVHGNCCSAY
jgi:hypothetical protein